MNPAALIPTPDAIPVPWGWFYILLMVTFLLHILVMNAMLGGGIIALISALRNDQQSTLLTKELSYKWPYTIAFAVNMGVAPLLFVQVLYGQFMYSSSLLMAVWWFSIFGLLILAYYAAYIYDFKFEALGNLRIFVLEFSLIILLFIGFMFSNNMTLMLHPEKWNAYFANGHGTLLNLSDVTLYPRYLHFVVGSVAIAGLFFALIGHFSFAKSNVQKETLINRGMEYFSYATGLQIFVGLWFFITLPTNIMNAFMGGNSYATLLIVCGIILAFAALYFAYKKWVLTTSWLALATLIVMIFMRDLVRIFYLQPYFKLSDLTVEPQYSPLIFFLATFVVGIIMIGYLLKLAFGCRKEVTK